MIGDRMVKFGADYGSFSRGGVPLGALIHSLEAPAKPGMANGLIQWTVSEGLSPHTMSDPSECLQGLSESHAGAHAGSNANMTLVGFEQTGYAAWDITKWTEPVAFAGVKNAARGVANLWKVMGWDKNDVEWGSVAQLQAEYNNYKAGRSWRPMMWTHYDVTRAWRQTTHTDPGNGYPYAIFRQLVKQYLGTWEGDQIGTPEKPAPGGVGGAEGSYLAKLLHWV